MNRYSFDSENHVHRLDGRPLMGCSTIVDVIGKGAALTWWGSGMAVGQLGWLHPKKNSKEACLQAATDALAKIQAMEPNEWLSKLNEAYRAHSTNLKETADEGTATHKACEDFIKYCMEQRCILSPMVEPPLITPFVEWAKENVLKFLWSEAHCYSEKMWTGGITDAGAILKDGTLAIIDFKRSREAYTGQFVQAAGYALMLEENGLFDKNGDFVIAMPKPVDALIIVPFRSNPVTPVIKTGIGKYKEGFRSALQLHKLLNGQ